MVKDINQLEKNVSASFAYVKKDLLMLNDAISDLHDKIQHLSMNHAVLLEKMQGLESKKPASKNASTKKAAKKPAAKKKTAKKAVAKKKTSKKASKAKPKKVVKETITYN